MSDNKDHCFFKDNAVVSKRDAYILFIEEIIPYETFKKLPIKLINDTHNINSGNLAKYCECMNLKLSDEVLSIYATSFYQELDKILYIVIPQTYTDYQLERLKLFLINNEIVYEDIVYDFQVNSLTKIPTDKFKFIGIIEQNLYKLEINDSKVSHIRFL